MRNEGEHVADDEKVIKIEQIHDWAGEDYPVLIAGKPVLPFEVLKHFSCSLRRLLGFAHALLPTCSVWLN